MIDTIEILYIYVFLKRLDPPHQSPYIGHCHLGREVHLSSLTSTEEKEYIENKKNL